MGVEFVGEGVDGDEGEVGEGEVAIRGCSVYCLKLGQMELSLYDE